MSEFCEEYAVAEMSGLGKDEPSWGEPGYRGATSPTTPAIEAPAIPGVPAVVLRAAPRLVTSAITVTAQPYVSPGWRYVRQGQRIIQVPVENISRFTGKVLEKLPIDYTKKDIEVVVSEQEKPNLSIEVIKKTGEDWMKKALEEREIRETVEKERRANIEIDIKNRQEKVIEARIKEVENWKEQATVLADKEAYRLSKQTGADPKIFRDKFYKSIDDYSDKILGKGNIAQVIADVARKALSKTGSNIQEAFNALETVPKLSENNVVLERALKVKEQAIPEILGEDIEFRKRQEVGDE